MHSRNGASHHPKTQDVGVSRTRRVTARVSLRRNSLEGDTALLTGLAVSPHHDLDIKGLGKPRSERICRCPHRLRFCVWSWLAPSFVCARTLMLPNITQAKGAFNLGSSTIISGPAIVLGALERRSDQSPHLITSPLP